MSAGGCLQQLWKSEPVCWCMCPPPCEANADLKKSTFFPFLTMPVVANTEARSAGQFCRFKGPVWSWLGAWWVDGFFWGAQRRVGQGEVFTDHFCWLKAYKHLKRKSQYVKDQLHCI